MQKKPSATDRLEQAINAIRRRNAHVEVEKAWERSWFRRLLIAVIIYVTACVYFIATDGDHERAVSMALIPAVAYCISTLSLPWVKSIWMKRWIRKYNKRKAKKAAQAKLVATKKKGKGKKK